jgi:hypothetical protein
MRWGHSKVYPNQYLVLVGPSGVRKAEPVLIAADFMRRVGLSMVSERIIHEALIRRMKDSGSTFNGPMGIGIQCAMTGAFEELAVFLGESNIQLLATLTNWYDARDHWTYETKHQGTDEIAGVCFNILASLADDWVPMCIPPTAIGGGFTSRVVFIVENEKARVISNPNLVQIDSKLGEDLEHDLQLIFAIQGEYAFTPDGLSAYEHWYLTTEKHAAEGKLAIKDPRFSGYNSRRATHVKKIAMALSASRSDDRLITKADFTRSLEMLEDAEQNMSSVFGRVGISPNAQIMPTIMEFIRKRRVVSKKDLMLNFYRDLDKRSLDDIEGNLIIMGLIRVESDEDKRTVYRWIPKGTAGPNFFE